MAKGHIARSNSKNQEGNDESAGNCDSGHENVDNSGAMDAGATETEGSEERG